MQRGEGPGVLPGVLVSPWATEMALFNPLSSTKPAPTPIPFAVADQNFDHKADLVLAGTQNATKGGAWGITWGIGVSLGNGDGNTPGNRKSTRLNSSHLVIS